MVEALKNESVFIINGMNNTKLMEFNAYFPSAKWPPIKAGFHKDKFF